MAIIFAEMANATPKVDLTIVLPDDFLRWGGLTILSLVGIGLIFPAIGHWIEKPFKEGIGYPVAQDNNLATWTAYRNQYWPAKYLIDAEGIVRSINFGEGNYAQT